MNDYFQSKINLVLLNLKIKNYNKAKKILKEVLIENSNNLDFLNILGVIHLEQDEFYKAEKIFLEINKKNPKNFNVNYNLGLLYEKLLNLDKSLEYYLIAYSIKKTVVLLNRLASLYFKLKNYNLSVKFFNESINLEKNFDAYNNLGVIFLNYKSEFNLAINCFLSAAAINPHKDFCYKNLGNAYMKLNQFLDAESTLKKSISLNKRYAEAYWDLGVLYGTYHRFCEAKKNLFKALYLDYKFFKKKNRSRILRSLGTVYIGMLDYYTGIKILKKAIKNQPDYFEAYSTLFFTYNYIKNYQTLELCKNFDSYSKIINSKYNKVYKKKVFFILNKKKLKVAFVSGDFFEHPVGFTIKDFLPELKKNVDLFAYSNSHSNSQFTKELNNQFSKWHNIHGKTIEEIIKVIRKDEIDILFDLSGHTSLNILPAFECRMAPIQVAWAGYLATTGIKNMDYIVADKITIPDDNKEFFTEKIYKLPNIWSCFSPIKFSPNINYKLQNNFITFGSFNNFLKYNCKVIELWSQILNSIPNSKLILVYSKIDSDFIKKKIIEEFIKFNVSEKKIIIKSLPQRYDVLNYYNEIDIALDPFPFSGCVTSFEATWMGCPILTKKGKTFLSRTGESINLNVGLKDFIADSDEDYVKKAVYYSNNYKVLQEIKKRLSIYCRNSNIFNTKLFAEDFYKMLLDMRQDITLID